MAYAFQLMKIYDDIKKLIWEQKAISIDSMAMRINYKITTSFLILSSCLVTAHSWFGKSDNKIPISCYTNGEEAVDKFADDYCWIHPKVISLDPDEWTKTKLDETNEGYAGVGDGKSHESGYYPWTP